MPLLGGKSPSTHHASDSHTEYLAVDPLLDPGLGRHGSAKSSSTRAITHFSYPRAPNLIEEPSAPPLPYNSYGQYGYAAPKQSDHSQQQAPLPPGQVLVGTPRIEAQPWAVNLWKKLATNTVGVARVDLRRPTFPWPEDYDTGNILFRRSSSRLEGQRARGRPRKQPPIVGYIPPGDATGPYYPPMVQQGCPPAGQEQPQAHKQNPTGARLKVMRCVQLKAPEDKRALLDLGLGVGVDLDRQELQGVCRLKVADMFSIKLLPQPLLKVGGSWPLPGKSGMALRLKYEVPLVHINEFWQPPARLLVRLDNDVGTGVHLTPTGIEFDERRLTLGKSTEVRAGATLRFPRNLPVDRDDPDALKLQVHRLSLKTLW